MLVHRNIGQTKPLHLFHCQIHCLPPSVLIRLGNEYVLWKGVSHMNCKNVFKEGNSEPDPQELTKLWIDLIDQAERAGIQVPPTHKV